MVIVAQGERGVRVAHLIGMPVMAAMIRDPAHQCAFDGNRAGNRQ